VGSLARQVDDGNSYLLTVSPSNVDANWLQFTGVNFPVNTVFGRVGDVMAGYGDYFDGDIELSANVGPVPAGNAVSEVLEYLANRPTANIDIVGNVTASGNVSAAFFIGNGSLLTGISGSGYVLPSQISADVLGNVTATGNVTADKFIGNGALLTGMQMGPAVSVYFGNAALQRLPNNSNTIPLFSNVIYDTTNGFSLVTRTYTPGVAGYYQVNGTTAWDGTVAAGLMQQHLFVNGARVRTLAQVPSTGVSSSTRGCVTSGSAVVYLTDTDNVTISIAQDMGATRDIVGGLDTAFTATLIAK
jgi:hypothetical protein